MEKTDFLSAWRFKKGISIILNFIRDDQRIWDGRRTYNSGRFQACTDSLKIGVDGEAIRDEARKRGLSQRGIPVPQWEWAWMTSVFSLLAYMR